MSFLTDIVNKFKGSPQAAVPQATPQATPIMAGVQQSQAATPEQVPANVNPQVQTNNGNKIFNALSKIAPANWDDTTRQKVMLASQFLTGLGSTQYDPNKGNFGNIAQGIANGGQNALKQAANYQNYQNAKRMYDQYGLDSSALSPFGDYSKFTPEAAMALGVKMRQDQTRRDIASEKDNTKRANLILTGLKNGTLSPEEAQAYLKTYGIDLNNLQVSNETRKTDSMIEKNKSQIEVNNARITKIKADIQQNAQKIKILQQRVNQGNATASDKATLNKLNIENKKLIIEQNQLTNQAMREQLGGGGGGNNPRPVGGSNVKVF